MGEYKGPERRKSSKYFDVGSRRAGTGFDRSRSDARSNSRFMDPARRRADRNAGRLLEQGDPPMINFGESPHTVGGDAPQDRRQMDFEPQVEKRKISDRRSRVDRRYGAGCRSGDLSRALKTGEPVIFDFAKMKPAAKKLAKKAGKAGKLGLAISAGSALYDMVSRNKE